VDSAPIVKKIAVKPIRYIGVLNRLELDTDRY